MRSRHVPKPISPEAVKKALNYDPATGVFLWRERTSNRINIGAEAGTINKNGYRVISIMGHRFCAHRLAWAHYYSEDAPAEIDHKDGDRANNCIKNLRAASHQQNTQNSRGHRFATSDYKGVSFFSEGKRRKRWRAQIMVSGKCSYLGRFHTEQEASAAYEKAAAENYGEFARAI